MDGVSVFDLSCIDDMDPSISDGYQIIYDREVPLEIRNHQGEADVRQGTLESIKVKLLLLGSEDAPVAFRIELSSEADLFFHYTHALDEQGYRHVQSNQKLMVEFSDYPHVLIRMLNSCIKEPHVYLGIFTLEGDIDARLDFIQNMEYKFVDLMTCGFVRSAEEIVQHHITYRYNSTKQKAALLQTRLHELMNLVKTKNPSLLLQLQKPVGVNSGSNGNMATMNLSSSATIASTTRR